MERSLSVLVAAVLGGWLIAVLLCNALFYRNVVNYEVLYREWRLLGEGIWAGPYQEDLASGSSGCRQQSSMSRAASEIQNWPATPDLLGFECSWSAGMEPGVSGGFLFLASGFPQDLAYLPSFFLLLICGRSDRPVQKRTSYFNITIILLAAGIWMELLRQSVDLEIVLKNTIQNLQHIWDRRTAFLMLYFYVNHAGNG